MARYADPDKTERVLVRFEREDLLWRGRLGTVAVPLEQRGKLLGPTVLDIVVRHPARGQTPAFWTRRPAGELLEHREARRRAQGHPLRASAIGSGKLVADEDTFVRVSKMTTLSLGPYALRLAVGAFGSVAAAHDEIGARAARAWRDDLDRASAVYERLQAADGNPLIETPELVALRPGSSVSGYVEAQLLRDACRLLGVDPDLDIRRPGGRPRRARSSATDQGDAIAVTLTDGRVFARTIAGVAGVAAFTDLAALPLAQLVALRDALHVRGSDVDVDLLEAFLDATHPDWRVAGDVDAASGVPSADDPYEVLGVKRTDSLETITRAYRSAMQALHQDKGHSRWFSQVLSFSYRRIKDTLTTPLEHDGDDA